MSDVVVELMVTGHFLIEVETDDTYETMIVTKAELEELYVKIGHALQDADNNPDVN